MSAPSPEASAARTLRAVPDIPTPSTADAAPDGWELPVPLTAGTRQLPAFPVDVLPAWVADMVTAVAEFTQTPLDLGGCIALSALSTACARRAVVQIRAGWIEPTNLFVLVALPPGNRKSPVFDAIVVPILEAQKTLQELAAPRIVMAQLERRLAERDAEKAEKHASLADPDSVQAATTAALHAQSIAIPAKPRLLGDDTTSEAATGLLAEQGGRLAILSDEGTIVANLAGRYSGAPNFEVFLKGHSGGKIQVDRRSREDEYVDGAALTLGLAVQPYVLRDLAAIPGGGVDEKGLLARFLFSVPLSTVGWRETVVPPIPQQVTNAYTARLAGLVLHLADWVDPAVLAFTPEANTAMLDLQNEVEPRLRPRAEWSHILGWGNKYAGTVARLTGLIHAATHTREPWTKPVTADTFGHARRLGDYFTHHALAAFEHMSSDADLDNARVLLGWITSERPTQFTRRDAHRANRARFRKATDIDPALALLEDHGHVRQAPAVDRPGAGRKPSPVYWVHPTYRTDHSSRPNGARNGQN